MVNLTSHLAAIKARIRQAEQLYGRTQNSVALLAASKTQPAQAIETLFQAGQIAFGENYVQEALAKMQPLAHLAIEWHFIGPIQSNKIQAIAQHFSWVHTLSRVKEAEMLSHARANQAEPLNVCIQVKLDNDPKRGGIVPAAVITLAEKILALPHLRLRGLMALPPLSDSFEQQRSYFNRVRKLQVQLNLDTLSMGMTDDLEAAIAEGATIVRVGSGLFGPREH